LGASRRNLRYNKKMREFSGYSAVKNAMLADDCIDVA
jgi:hypothetical protein